MLFTPPHPTLLLCLVLQFLTFSPLPLIASSLSPNLATRAVLFFSEFVIQKVVITARKMMRDAVRMFATCVN